MSRGRKKAVQKQPEESDDISYDEKLTIKVIKVNSDETMELKHCFGKLLRSDVEIDRNHNYCSLCLKSKIIKR